MSGRNSLRYCYDVSYQCWFASEEAKIYCNNFNSSNAVVCSHLILAYTVRLAMINAAELERNGCFSLPLLRNVVLWLKRTSTKSLQIELVTKYDINDAQKESFFFFSSPVGLICGGRPSALICCGFCWMRSPCCASSPSSLGKSIFGHTFDRVWR